MRWRYLAVALLVTALQACSLTRPVTPPVVDGHQEGVGSWYGPGFHGKRTANGEVYDQYELTAAHQTLPLGTRVMVTSLTNDRAVEVRINDRGPFIGGRIVDLSYAAASVIGMIGPGTMRVSLEVLDAPVQIASRRPVAPRVRRTAPAPRRIEPAELRPRNWKAATAGRDAQHAARPSTSGAASPSSTRTSPIDAGVDRHCRGSACIRPAVAHWATRVNRFGYLP
jgi:rare lipoprotein A (peptidoglycan hydrolase)